MTASSSSAEPTQEFENPAGAIWYYPSGYIRLVWHRGPVRDALVRDLYKAATEALHQRGITRIMSDHRHMPPLSPALQRWLSDEWVPSAVREAGYNRGAVVQAYNLFNRLATDQIVTQLNNAQAPVQVEYFDNDYDAERWLLSEEPGSKVGG